MKKILTTVFALLLLTNSALAQENIGILPDNPLYPIKTAVESLFGFLTSFGTQEKQVEYDLDIANKRLQEAKALSRAGKTALARQTLERHAQKVLEAEIKAIQVPKETKKVALVQRIFERKKAFATRIKAIPVEIVPQSLRDPPTAVEAQLIPLDVMARMRFGAFLGEAQKQCETTGGNWRLESEFVGCEGVSLKLCENGFPSLFDDAIRACEAVKGMVVCSDAGVFCKRG